MIQFSAVVDATGCPDPLPQRGGFLPLHKSYPRGHVYSKMFRTLQEIRSRLNFTEFVGIF